MVFFDDKDEDGQIMTELQTDAYESEDKNLQMKTNFFFTKSYFFIFFILLFVNISVIGISCSAEKEFPLKCLVDHIYSKVEKKEVENFISLNGTKIWQEGWEKLTTKFAEDHYMVEQCQISEYLLQYEENLDNIRGQMILVYSIHSYLKNKEVNPKIIKEKVDSLFFRQD